MKAFFRNWCFISLLIISQFVVWSKNEQSRLIKEQQLIPKQAFYVHNNSTVLSNKWIVESKSMDIVNKLASANNFTYRGQVEILDDLHVLESPSNLQNAYTSRDFLHHKDIENIYRLPKKFLFRRGYTSFANNPYGSPEDLTNIEELYQRKIDSIETSLRKSGIIRMNDHIKSSYKKEFNDELWPLQWYEMGYKVDAGRPLLDMNLIDVYQKYNITGRGVNVVIIDDGIEYTHEDIRDNFDPSISFNMNFNKTDIQPRYEDPRNRHGTRCAGVIVMKPNNNKCGVGIAYGAKVGGITLLDGPTDDHLEAQAVTFSIEKVHIYSGSWGPQDTGTTLDGPGFLVSSGLYYGVTHGRKGRGALYVFAAGNGGIFEDHCGADGYVNSIYAMAIASATQNGGVPYYGERCAAIIATTYSGNRKDAVKIVATDINNTCTVQHSGTSASAPLAAGILALVLEANELLTWRDVQHLVIASSERSCLTPNVDWALNGFGLWYTPQFGFGLINAFKLVTMAKEWQSVPQKYICSIPLDLGNRLNRKFSSSRSFTTAVKTLACNATIQFLEHVQLNTTISYQMRGNLQIELISPSGTVSKLLEPRKHDKNTIGFREWIFMSRQFWGEPANGTWAIVISDELHINHPVYRGVVNHLNIILHGTKENPMHYMR